MVKNCKNVLLLRATNFVYETETDGRTDGLRGGGDLPHRSIHTAVVCSGVVVESVSGAGMGWGSPPARW